METARSSVRRSSVLLVGVMGLLALPAAASAHVELEPSSAPAGSSTLFQVRVPNESDRASTVKLELKLPAGVASATYQAVPGWTARVVKSRLAKPVQTDDGPITEGVSEVVWTAQGKGIEPGQFQAFGLTLLVPDQPGVTLSFKTLQTYSDGNVSRWIGAADSMEPAPTLSVEESSSGHSGMVMDGSSGVSMDGGSHAEMLSVIALVVAALALLVAAAGLVRARRNG
ncbi:MAG: YcnI family protein [Solirubrobacterales bacterium]|nr:YcnI family protein [Solirubrobacterales bacterium]